LDRSRLLLMSRPEPDEFEGLFDVIDAGLIVLDSDRRVRAWNEWMTIASGVAADQARDRFIEEIFPEASNSRLVTAVTEALDAGVSSVVSSSLHGAVLPLRSRTGRRLVHNLTIRPIAGELPRCLIQVSDVTLATEREKVLRDRQNARYDAVVDSAPDAILTIDAEGVIQLANPAAAHELGYSSADLVGQPIDLIFADEEAWAPAWAKLLGGNPLNPPVELRSRRKDGSISFVEVSAARWRSDARIFVTAILRDVNERRAVEARLRDLNESLERRVAERTADRDRMWRLSNDLMLVARPDGTISSTNPAWKDLLDWDEADLLGSPLREFVVPEDRADLEAALAEMLRTGSSRLFELGMRVRDGGTRLVAWNAIAVDGLMQAVGRDMTVERRAQTALLEAEEALRQSSKMEALGQLTGGIAHDFNNLLSGIIGAMDLLKMRLADRRYESIERLADTAINSADRAAALTHRLLAFARRQPLDSRPVDINGLIRGMEDLLRRSLGEQVALEISLADRVWPVLVDANQLENALLNLAINGRDAMPDGGRLGIRTATGVVEHGDRTGFAPGEYTIISVTDSGVGMDREVLARAFDPFFTTKPVGQGTGLGLSMIYGFIKQSRGQINIDSAPGKGTTVKLYLPRQHGAVPETVENLRRGALTEGAGETVLVVEDDPSIRLLIIEVLNELGYASLQAADGNAALAVLGSNARLDLMVTDVGLPGINGRQLADIARKHRPNLKVLFLTGYAEHATARSEFLVPGMEMMTKPFAIAELARKIRQIIEMECA
jgi:PAS domain S-box-containing protein